MTIDYAFLMTEQELGAYFERLKNSYSSKNLAAIKNLESQSELFIKGYENYENECVKNYYYEREQLHSQLLRYKERKCICGSSLRLITHPWGNFYGCPNYMDGSEHTKFSELQEQTTQQRLERLKVRIDSNWLTEILKNLTLNKSIRASELLDFYTFNGLEDLREKYGYTNTKDRISGYQRASLESKKEEKEIREFVNSFFSKVDVQRGIRYKLANDNKERIIIIDLIVPFNNTIYLIEIKRNVWDIRVEQLHLYYAALTHIVKKSDNRVIKPVFLVYNTPEYSGFYRPANFVLFEQIKGALNAEDIVWNLEKGVNRFYL